MYSVESRNIFQYIAGGQVRWADPIAVLRKLKLVTGGRLSQLLEQSNALTATPERPAAEEGSSEYLSGLAARGQLASATIAAFDLEPFDPFQGTGTLEEEALDALRSFLEWQSQKKTSGETSP